MNKYDYLVIDADLNVEAPVACDTEASAMEQAAQMMQNNSIDHVAIYKLQKIGSRQIGVNWEEPKTNGRADLERPVYRGSRMRWGDDEKVY